MLPNILITGFAPFGGETVNPSWQAAQRLDGRVIAGHTVVAREIPCVFGVSRAVLEAAVMELRPAVAILAGQAGGSAELRVERIAVNLDDSDVADNDGNVLTDSPVLPDAPTAYLASLPVKTIVAEMRRAGLPATLSNSAGNFVCNHLFYGACHLRAERFKTMQVGFIHVPYEPEQLERHPDAPAMPLDAMIDGLRIAVEAAVGGRDPD